MRLAQGAGVQQMGQGRACSDGGCRRGSSMIASALARATQSQDAYDALAPLIVDAKTLAQDQLTWRSDGASRSLRRRRRRSRRRTC